MVQALAEIDNVADKIVRELGIPPCPAILTKLLNEVRQEEPDYAKASKLIVTDVGLAGAMLKTVNSPFFGLKTKATSVNQALQMMGLRNTVELVTGLLLRQAFPVGDNSAMESFWRTTAGIAEVAAQLASPLGFKNRDEAYTFALFRDCGIPLMIRKFPGYTNLLKTARPQNAGTITADETQQFGIDHATIGARLAQSWMLPDETSIAIQSHHEYQLAKGAIPEGSSRLVALVMAAEWIYGRHKFGSDCPEWLQGGDLAIETLDTSAEALLVLAQSIEQ